MAAVAAGYEKIKELGGDVLAISTDTKFSHQAFVKTEPLMKDVKFLLGADPTGNVCRAYDAYMEEAGLARRAMYIINPDGVIVSLMASEPPVGKSVSEILRQLEAWKYVYEHPEEACPANWAPGKKTLKPGPDIAGRVGEVVSLEEILKEVTASAYKDYKMG